MSTYSLSKTATIALFLYTQYPWHFDEMAKAYGWTCEDVEEAKAYLKQRSLKPYGEN